MNITIDSTIQAINFNYGGVDYPVKTLKYENAEEGIVTPEDVWEEITGPKHKVVKYIYLTTPDTNKTVWVDTGILSANNLELRLKGYISTINGNFYVGHTGTALPSSSNDRADYRWFMSGQTIYLDVGNARTTNGSYQSQILNHDVDISMIVNGTTCSLVNNLNNETIMTNDSSNVTQFNKYDIFILLNGMKFTSLTITNSNNETLFDGYASIDENNLPCVYDSVSNTLIYPYRNSQTAGTVVIYEQYPEQVNINASSNDSTMGYVSGGGMYWIGDNVTLNAVSNEGYHFVGWYSNGSFLSPFNSYTFTVSESTTFIAMFEADIDYSLEYFTIRPLEDNCEVTITKNTSAPNKTWYYSKDKTNWSSFSYTTTITANSNEKVYFYSTGAMVTISNNTPQYYWQINASKQFNVSGNIMSLLFGTNFVGQTSLASYTAAFYELFRSYGITSTIVDASNLILPATTLSNWCYGYMFVNCDSLTKAPKLPATTLVYECYDSMFLQCYSLAEITCLATNISAGYCTRSWVYQVAATGTFYKDPNMTSWTTGVAGIPSGWTVVDYA